MISNIYLDMDGVCVDFFGGCVSTFGAPKDLDPYKHKYHELFGLSLVDFWEVIKSHGDMWWEDLKPLPYMDELIAEVERIDPDWMLLTSPVRGGFCASGKTKWIEKHFGEEFRRYSITCGEYKKRLAHNSLLIDDTMKNCQDFENCGGKSILFPQAWNPHFMISDPLAYTKKKLKEYTSV